MWNFVKQKRKNESAPVALLNLGKHLKLKFGYGQYIKLFRQYCACKNVNDHVTGPNTFSNALGYIFNWVTHINPLGAIDDEAYLRKTLEHHDGIVVMFLDDTPHGYPHYALLTRIDARNCLVVINYKTTVDHVSMNEFLNKNIVKAWGINSLLK